MSMSQRTKRDKKLPKSDLSSPGLIFHVAKCPVIWDHNRQDHKDRGAVEAAFEAISKNFYGCEARDCASLWDALCRRRRDHKQRQAAKEPSGAAANPRARQFKYAKEMSFLDAVPQDPLGEGNLQHLLQRKIVTAVSSSSESEEDENDGGPDSPMKQLSFVSHATDESEIMEGSETGDSDNNVIDFTMGNEEKEHSIRKQRYEKKRSKKQAEFAKRREALKIKIAEQVKEHKKAHFSKKIKSVKSTKGSGATCSLEEMLISELRSLKEDDETDLFFRSVALRLQKLPSASANSLMSYFWNETYKALYK